ncbi:MAG: acetylornithine/succinylornithine family transaminase [Anaerolineales bacterium]|nr:acetylornithine/succinylornithine family transaminase [Anaerolineales bacterium]
MTDTIELETKYTSGLYVKRPIEIVRGQGALVWDEKGRQYIDCVAGQGSANLGHCHPAVVRAITEQAQTLITCTEMFFFAKRGELERRLVEAAGSGFNRVFLCNSGTEAIEGSIKLARYATGRTDFVAAKRGFHGRTMGALSATWNKKYRDAFLPLVPGFAHVTYNQLEELDAAVNEKTAGVILEAVQAEGGVYPGTAEYLRGAQEICRRKGAMLILDEVQTGFCRTGRMFAYQHYGLQPDFLALAKSIGGGIPMGAIVIGERIRPLEPAVHANTFGGNPLTSAAGVAAIDAYEEERLAEKAAELGAHMAQRLRAISSALIREVRGLGLLIGIEIKQKAAPYLAALAERGVLALPAGLNVIRLLPPLVITKAQLDEVADQLAAVLADQPAARKS